MGVIAAGFAVACSLIMIEPLRAEGRQASVFSAVPSALPSQTAIYVECPDAAKLLKRLSRPFGSQLLQFSSKETGQNDETERLRRGLRKLIGGTQDENENLARQTRDGEHVSHDNIAWNLIESLATLVDGPAFFSVLNESGDSALLLGFQYDPEVLDWGEMIEEFELESTAEVDSGSKIQFRRIPSEGLTFFVIDQSLFIYSGTESDFIHEFVMRVTGKKNTQSLAKDRSFERVANLLDYGNRDFDLFVYSNADNFPAFVVNAPEEFGEPKIRRPNITDFEGLDIFQIQNPPNRSMLFANYTDFGWSPIFGFKLKFDQGDESLQYESVFPLLLPIDGTTKKVMTEAFGDVEVDRDRIAFAFDEMLFFCPEELRGFPRFLQTAFNSKEMTQSFWRVGEQALTNSNQSYSLQTHLSLPIPNRRVEQCRFLVSRRSGTDEQRTNETVTGVFYSKSDLQVDDLDEFESTLEREGILSPDFEDLRTKQASSIEAHNRLLESLRGKEPVQPKPERVNQSEQFTNQSKMLGVGSFSLIETPDCLIVASSASAGFRLRTEDQFTERFNAEELLRDFGPADGKAKAIAISTSENLLIHYPAMVPIIEFYDAYTQCVRDPISAKYFHERQDDWSTATAIGRSIFSRVEAKKLGSPSGRSVIQCSAMSYQDRVVRFHGSIEFRD